MADIKCNLRINFLGLRRTGNHAIINWLLPMYDGIICHFNDNSEYYKLYENGKQIKNDVIDNVNVVIINYENLDLELSKTLPANKNNIISDNVITILLLRDPFNTMASLYENQKTVKNPNWRVPIYNLPRLWVQYAREFIEPYYLPSDTVKINFNEWFKSVKYRNKVANKLGLVLSDENLNLMSGYGGGSSFDLLSYQNNAQRLDVLNRWKAYKNNPKILNKLLLNKKLVKLSNTIFGEIIKTN